MLHSAPASPFARKVRIAAALLGFGDRIAVLATNTLSTEDPVRRDNPLGKIPTLVLEDGATLFDSAVILAYFDLLAPGALYPADPLERLFAQRDEALADGLSEAAVLMIYEERFRAPDRREPAWLAHQQGKIDRTLAHVALAPPPVSARPGAPAIALACALGYLDLRHGGRWREGRPALEAWLHDFSQAVPAFAQTQAPG
jgi:glutathione S-transferase